MCTMSVDSEFSHDSQLEPDSREYDSDELGGDEWSQPEQGDSGPPLGGDQCEFPGRPWLTSIFENGETLFKDTIRGAASTRRYDVSRCSVQSPY